MTVGQVMANLLVSRIALLATNFSSPQEWLRNDFLPGVVVIIGGVLVARAVRWVEERYRIDLDRRLQETKAAHDVVSERLKRSRAVVEAVGWTAIALVYIITLTLGINIMGVPLVTLVAPATVAGVAIGFGAQQVVGDLLAGFFLFAEHQFGYGDDIRFSQPGQTKGVAGTVEEMTLRVTKLRTIEGELVIIPNSLLGQVTNLSKDWSQAVLDLPIAVGEDLELTNLVLRDASMTLATDPQWSPLLLREPVVAGVQRVEVGYYLVRVLVRTLPGRQFEVLRELRLRCATALTAAGIASPHIDLYGSGG
jgi:small conductance mechanosensitive channel